MIEIQYRTLVQHAWATAVEVAGLLTHNNPKFGQGVQKFIDFFAVSSEILARAYEGASSSLPDLSDDELVNRLAQLEDETRILQLFRRVNAKVVEINFKMNNVLIFPLVSTQDQNQAELVIYSYGSVAAAIEAYNRLEGEQEGKSDVVLVRADTFENMRVTFRNYFADTREFVQMLDDAVEALVT